MKHIYEYLIGGRKTGKGRAPIFNDLNVGDYFYAYSFNKSGNDIISNVINEYKITKIQTLTHVRLYEFKYGGSRGIEPKDYDQKLVKQVDNADMKEYFATNLDVLLDAIDNPKKPQINYYK